MEVKADPSKNIFNIANAHTTLSNGRLVRHVPVFDIAVVCRLITLSFITVTAGARRFQYYLTACGHVESTFTGKASFRSVG